MLPNLYDIRHITKCCTQGNLRVLDAWFYGRKNPAERNDGEVVLAKQKGVRAPHLTTAAPCAACSLIILTCEDEEDTNARLLVREERIAPLPA